MELIPGLSDDIALDCLARLPYTCHRLAANVSRRWNEVTSSAGFWALRKRSRRTQLLACLMQATAQRSGEKLLQPPNYGLTVFDPRGGRWERLPPVSPAGMPLFCQLAGVGGKLLVLGGWDPVSWAAMRSVFVYDFTLGEWRRGKNMPAARSFFAAVAIEGRVYIAGGHDESKNALRTAAVYDVEEDEWREIAEMGEERDECEGLVVGGEFWVVSGYPTERQGKFESSLEVYEPRKGEWRRAEGAWGDGDCPRACLGATRGGRLVCWGKEETAVRVGCCAVGFGERVLLTGLACPGAPHGFYMVGLGEEKQGILESIDPPEGFRGFVQSGCCLEI